MSFFKKLRMGVGALSVILAGVAHSGDAHATSLPSDSSPLTRSQPTYTAEQIKKIRSQIESGSAGASLLRAIQNLRAQGVPLSAIISAGAQAQLPNTHQLYSLVGSVYNVSPTDVQNQMDAAARDQSDTDNNNQNNNAQNNSGPYNG